MSDLKDKIILNIHKGMDNNMLSNDDLVQIIEHSGKLLNLQTVSDYAKSNGISYNGAKKYRHLVSLFNIKFIIDNE